MSYAWLRCQFLETKHCRNTFLSPLGSLLWQIWRRGKRWVYRPPPQGSAELAHQPVQDWSCHRSGLYCESGDGFLLQQFFWVCYHLQYHAGVKPPPKLLITCRKFLLIYNNFVGSNSFITKLSLKVQNIEPIKLVYILTSQCQNMMSQLLTSFITKF